MKAFEWGPEDGNDFREFYTVTQLKDVELAILNTGHLVITADCPECYAFGKVYQQQYEGQELISEVGELPVFSCCQCDDGCIWGFPFGIKEYQFKPEELKQFGLWPHWLKWQREQASNCSKISNSSGVAA